jgi:zinc D-Ala-D-Ala dipeptidase
MKKTMHTFPALSSPQILSIHIHECREVLVDIKESGAISYGPAPEYPETEKHYTLVRKTVYGKLVQAQALLPRGLRLRLYEGYRHPDTQIKLFDQELQRAKKRHPESSEEKIFLHATRLVSPVINFDGTANIPPHCTGGAIDVEIINSKGNVLDFGMEIRNWSSVHPDLCRTDYSDLSTNSAKNRKLLLHVMTQSGFTDYPNEWWHFSYGDRYWAFRTGHKHAIYGIL